MNDVSIRLRKYNGTDKTEIKNISVFSFYFKYILGSTATLSFNKQIRSFKLKISNRYRYN